MIEKMIFYSLILASTDASLLHAEERPVIELHIKDGHFVPNKIQGPAGVKFTLKISNEGATPEEFESISLNREKIIPAGKTVFINLGPLSKSTHSFFGDFHRDTAQGELTIIEQR